MNESGFFKQGGCSKLNGYHSEKVRKGGGVEGVWGDAKHPVAHMGTICATESTSDLGDITHDKGKTDLTFWRKHGEKDRSFDDKNIELINM